MPAEEAERLFSLHRYFLHSSSMRRLYEDRIRDYGAAAVDSDDWVQQWVYLCLWYATLYVVVEGWRDELRLSSVEVDALLADVTMVESLRRFRNGTFHFQGTYYDDRLIEFVGKGEASAQWVALLHDALSNDLLARLRAAHETP